MKLRSITILLIILASLGGAFYINMLLKRVLNPRKSLSRLFLYIVSAFALVFGYTFLVVWVIARIFPLPNN
ncbi:MAG TPA: hypothetical protein VKR32_05735 [Puia sp.]|nr:hypothetical protein [Puia sp.]